MTDNNLDLSDVHIPGIDDGDRELTDSVRYHGPPGTGKTTTAAAHVARIIESTDYSRSNICWITYRKSLATETLDRLIDWGIFNESDKINPSRGATRFISTAHAVGNRAVGGLPDPAGLSQQIGFCETMGMDYWDDDPWGKGDGELLFRVFQWMKNNLLDPADESDLSQCTSSALEDFRAQSSKSIPRLWEEWEEYKDAAELIDFADQLKAPLDTKTHVPCPILIVDEYHDAYPLMAELVERWIDDAEIALVAGDPDQVVNSFDGASPEFFESLELPSQLLGKSWRVPTGHWEPATALLRQAPGHSPPDVETESGGDVHTHTSPGLFEREQSRREADIGYWSVPPVTEGHPGYIAVRHGLGGNNMDAPGVGNDPGSVLFLARTRNQVRGISAALDASGMIYTTQRDIPGWGSKKGGGAPKRRLLFNALDAIRGFDPDNAEKDLYPNTLSLGGSDDGTAGFELSAASAAALLDATAASTHSQQRTQTDSIVDQLYDQEDRPLDEQEFSQWVEPEFWTKYTHGAESVDNKGKLLQSAIKGRERAALKNALARHAGAGPIDADEIGVEVMTIHASKGHEARDVVLYTGITNRIKKALMSDPDERANEYRTWYVACTRASERLHIVDGGFSWLSELPDQPFSRGYQASISGVVSDD